MVALALLVTAAALGMVTGTEQPENSVGKTSFKSRGILSTENVAAAGSAAAAAAAPAAVAGAAAAAAAPAHAAANTLKASSAQWWQDGRRDDIFNCTVPVPGPSWLVDIKTHNTARACARRCRSVYLDPAPHAHEHTRMHACMQS